MASSAVVGLLRVLLTADTAEFDSAMKKASASAKSWEKDLKAIGQQASTIGAALTKAITVPLVGIATMAIKTGVEFEGAMNSIQGVLTPTGAEMERVRATAIKMGADTAFSATDAANAMLELGKAGFTTAEAISAVPQVLELAAASGLDMGAAAELAARSLNSFGLETKDLSHVNDVLAKAVNSSTLEIGDMQTAFKYVGPIAQGFGVSIEEVSASLAIMRDNGIAAETAGRGLREGLSRLANPVKAVVETAQELGLTLAQLNPETNSFADIIKRLEERGLTAAQALAMFGDAAGPGMFALVNKGSEALVGLTEEFKNSEGAAKAMADAMMTGLPGALEQLRGSVETAWIAISKAIEPTVIRVTEELKKLVDLITNKLAPAFMELPAPVQSTAIGFTALFAAAGPVLWALGQLITAAGTVIGLFKEGAIGARILTGAFTVMSAPITGIVTVIGGLAVAWASFKGDWVRAFDVLIPPLGGFRNAIDQVQKALEPYQSLISDVAAVARGVFSQAWAIASTALAQFRDSYLVPLQDKFNSFKNTVSEIANALRGILVSAFNQAKQAVIDFLPGLQTLLNTEARLRDWAAKGRQHLSELANEYRRTAAEAATAAGNLASTSLAGANAFAQFSTVIAQAGAAAAGAAPQIRLVGDATEKAGKKAKDATKDYREFMNWVGERQMEAAAIGIEAMDKLAASLQRGIAAMVPFKESVKSTGEEITKLGGSIHDLVSGSIREYALAAEAARQATLDWANANGAVLAPSIKMVSAQSLLAEGETKGAFARIFGSAEQLGQGISSIFMAAFTGGGGALGAVQAFATQTLSTLMGMIPGIGPFIQGFAGPIIAMLSKLTKKFADFFRNIFGGPSADELAGREIVGAFEDELAGLLTDQQKLEAGGEAWKETVIAIRDAYIAMGRTEEEALADAKRLWEASKQGADAAARVIEEIRRKMRELTDGTHTIDIEYRVTAPDGAGPIDFGSQDWQHTQPVPFDAPSVASSLFRPSTGLDLGKLGSTSISNNSTSSINILPMMFGGGMSSREFARAAMRHLAESGLPNNESGVTDAIESVIGNYRMTYAR